MSKGKKQTIFRGEEALLSNTPAQAESPLHNLQQAARDIGLYKNSNKSEFICFVQGGTIFQL